MKLLALIVLLGLSTLVAADPAAPAAVKIYFGSRHGNVWISSDSELIVQAAKAFTFVLPPAPAPGH